jgi:hypothetical protein
MFRRRPFASRLHQWMGIGWVVGFASGKSGAYVLHNRGARAQCLKPHEVWRGCRGAAGWVCGSLRIRAAATRHPAHRWCARGRLDELPEKITVFDFTGTCRPPGAAATSRLFNRPSASTAPSSSAPRAAGQKSLVKPPPGRDAAGGGDAQRSG